MNRRREKEETADDGEREREREGRKRVPVGCGSQREGRERRIPSAFLYFRSMAQKTVRGSPPAAAEDPLIGHLRFR
eukprot:scaffold55924_cov28-Tisochrysis_lutea.AAC.1